ncbi:MAG: hypothetical protein M0R48_11825 [Candidatus Omnitrophica bacterium]|nr:hypothetical protein [Candidatus Omnitrophota bacterium]
MPTSKITSSVDYYIKEAYEATFDPGKVVYKDMIEEAMLKRIEEINPLKACKLRIDRYKQLLHNEEDKLDELEDLEREAKRSARKQNQAQNSELDHFRTEKFHDKREALVIQYNKGSLDFTKNAGIFRFTNVNEFKEWIIPLLNEA